MMAVKMAEAAMIPASGGIGPLNAALVMMCLASGFVLFLLLVDASAAERTGRWLIRRARIQRALQRERRRLEQQFETKKGVARHVELRVPRSPFIRSLVHNRNTVDTELRGDSIRPGRITTATATDSGA